MKAAEDFVELILRAHVIVAANSILHVFFCTVLMACLLFKELTDMVNNTMILQHSLYMFFC